MAFSDFLGGEVKVQVTRGKSKTRYFTFTMMRTPPLTSMDPPSYVALLLLGVSPATVADAQMFKNQHGGCASKPSVASVDCCGDDGGLGGCGVQA